MVEEFWQAYLATVDEQSSITEQSYQSWHFMTDDPKDEAFADELTELVKKGEKKATATLAYIYEINQLPIPEVGSYHVITTFAGIPTNVVRVTKISCVPYSEVSAEHAYLEGEGDRSLTYWREVHQRFFTALMSDFDKAFSTDLMVLCIEFTVVY